jgi:hypothetical protein
MSFIDLCTQYCAKAAAGGHYWKLITERFAIAAVSGGTWSNFRRRAKS